MDTKLFIVLNYSTQCELSIYFLAEIWICLIWGCHSRFGRRCWNWVFLKPSSSAEFMINLFIQNFIPFLVMSLFPSRLRRVKGKGGLKLSRALWGPPGYKSPFISLHFLFVEKDFSLLGLPWVPNSRLKQLLIREVRECKVVKQEK